MSEGSLTSIVHYTATSLEDIADEFDNRAESCRIGLSNARTKRETTVYAAQANIWETAADMLRHTTIKEKE